MRNELLVIEDADVHLSIICKIAAQAGFAATGVNSVDAAAAVLRERSFDCITLDLSLGEQWGTDILKLLVNLKSRPPVLIISASDGDTRNLTRDAAKVFGLNIHPPISKPIDLRALRQTLRQIAAEAEHERHERALAQPSNSAHTTSDCN